MPTTPSWFTKILRGAGKFVGVGPGNTRLYVALGLDGARLGRTSDVIQNQQTTPWKETIRVYCAHTAAEVVFSVRIQSGDDLFGRTFLPVQELLASPDCKIERSFHLLDKGRREMQGRPQLRLSIQFKNVAADGLAWGCGVGGAAYAGVPRTFYPQRPGSRVTLYQDAHAPDSFAPQIPLAGSGNYEPGRCWEDVFDAISTARHLVYITGWSVYTEITLIRDGARPRPGVDATLGELLKRKASEGVNVLMLVWEDPTSIGPVVHRNGLMRTHDQDTSRYFHDSGVHCILAKRNSRLYSHHQKTIVVDHEMPVGDRSSQRHIVSFVGGIDLCDGRYDTQSHSLFGTLGTVHRKDFYQHSLDGAELAKGGPREPWHDIHSKLEGPAAWDVLDNFERRWSKQTKGGDNGVLVDVAHLIRRGLIISRSSPVVPPGDKEAWNVQVFRSIDSTSVVGFPESMEERFDAGLVPGNNLVTERSIQDAYIQAIRRAKNFIYIENQYFIGSSFQWKADDDSSSFQCKADDDGPTEIGAMNLIPRELSLKIVSKIKAGERFAVYVVLPLWPEGNPGDGPVQEILLWQRKTMEMMYGNIAEVLDAMKMEADPRDYLTFFCLGNREVKKSGEYQPAQLPEKKTLYAKAQQMRRFMIYVHSKMMIVDDEYIIVGSANINQRSMDGGRDTEIAMGAFQPHHINTSIQPARGQVHGFRMSLWYEHLSTMHDEFLHPASLGCIRRVNKMAEDTWNLYAQDNMLDKDLPAHLLAYPIKVTHVGMVTDLTECFPDTQAPVHGKKNWFSRGPLAPLCFRAAPTHRLRNDEADDPAQPDDNDEADDPAQPDDNDDTDDPVQPDDNDEIDDPAKPEDNDETDDLTQPDDNYYF